MITNKDIRVEKGSLILNGDPYPLDGQSPETIMKIVKDNSDTTPTENSDAPITSGGIYTALTGKAEKNPSVFSDYTHDSIKISAKTATLNNIIGGYKIKDGICYVNTQINFTGTFNTPGAWSLLSGFPPSAIEGVPLLASVTNNDPNSVALMGSRMSSTGNIVVVNSGPLTGDNSNGFTFVGSYPIAQS